MLLLLLVTGVSGDALSKMPLPHPSRAKCGFTTCQRCSGFCSGNMAGCSGGTDGVSNCQCMDGSSCGHPAAQILISDESVWSTWLAVGVASGAVAAVAAMAAVEKFRSQKETYLLMDDKA